MVYLRLLTSYLNQKLRQIWACKWMEPSGALAQARQSQGTKKGPGRECGNWQFSGRVRYSESHSPQPF